MPCSALRFINTMRLVIYNLFLSAFYFISTCTLVAQNLISGIVKDDITGEEIGYAHIFSKKGWVVATTNSDGFFQISLEEFSSLDTLLFSHIGFKTKSIGVTTLRFKAINIIELESEVTILKEVLVSGKNPYDYFREALVLTKSRFVFPFSTKFYYRELVKDNDDYSKYSDAILTTNYTSSAKDISVGIDQIRVLQLPRENDDVLDLVSPVEVSKILQYQYLNILDRFQGDNMFKYEFVITGNPETPTKIVYIIKPKVKPVKNELLYNGWIVTENDIIQNIRIKTDSLCDWQRSMLGLTVGINSFEINLTYSELDSEIHLTQGIVDLSMTLARKDFTQKNKYHSQFISIEPLKGMLTSIDKKNRLKHKTLYKHGSNYSYNFWENPNMPIATNQELELLKRLGSDGAIEKHSKK